MAADGSDIPPFAQAAAGAAGAIVSNSIVYPLDLISTRIQTSKGKAASTVSPWQALRDIVQKRGPQGLYQGLGTDNLSSTISNFLFFYFRAAITERFHQRKLARTPPSSGADKRVRTVALTPGEDLAAGALAGICSRAFTTPLSNITVRKQTHSTSSSSSPSSRQEKKSAGDDGDSSSDEETTFEDEPSMMDVVNEIVKDKGIAGLWSGFETAILLSVTPATTFYLTNIFSRMLLPRKSRDAPNAAQIFLTSALGNAASTGLLYPLILAKTLLQYRDPSGRRMYRNLADVVFKVVRRRGLKGMYQGLESQLIKGLLAHGVTMMVKSRVEALFVLLFLAAKRRGRASPVSASTSR